MSKPLSWSLAGLIWLSGMAAGLAQQAPLPPLRPATSAAGQPTQPQKVEPPPSLDRINAYFNAMRGMQANFIQTAPDGRKFDGVLYLLRPGRMRFEYAPPATLEIVADGRTVRILDRKLKTWDDYFIGQTPLKFLLQPKIDIAKDTKVIDLKRFGPEIILTIEDKSTLGGTSRIRVIFDGETYALKEWIVTDPQGSDTRVALSNLNLAALPDKALFVIDEQRLVEPKN
ncbi:outer membrane lipoprotein carrier protein LolA [Rhabdaerophilum sp. SD176]|uniref:outer membrane lipoprotein carrier protein LolA n=1 Tax=Rhabdaerophilum sp. SD176 TaxID=2983548 RepID=UPI0024DFE89C|nr:outer membrane lipoprotein carrier protein LolA [Rhabdaerophilum sp. SD176]